MSAAIGDQPMVGAGDVPTGPAQSLASPVVEVTIELLPAETRNLTSEQLGNLWREASRDAASRPSGG